MVCTMYDSCYNAMMQHYIGNQKYVFVQMNPFRIIINILLGSNCTCLLSNIHHVSQPNHQCVIQQCFNGSVHNTIEHTHVKYQIMHLNAKYHEMILMMKLLNMNVNQHVPQNRESDIITHVTLNTVNNVVCFSQSPGNSTILMKLELDNLCSKDMR